MPTWRLVELREAHRLCCAAQAIGDMEAELEQLTRMRDLCDCIPERYRKFGHMVKALRQELGLPADPMPNPPLSAAHFTATAASAAFPAAADHGVELAGTSQRAQTSMPPPPVPVVPVPPHAPSARRTLLPSTLPACPVGEVTDGNALSNSSQEPLEEPMEEFESQASQASQDGESTSSLKCSICLDVLYEPIRHKCGNAFCQPCYYPAISSAGGSKDAHASTPGTKRCPLCREVIPLEEVRTATVDQALWEEVQRHFGPAKIASRRKQCAALHPAAASAMNGGAMDGGGGRAVRDESFRRDLLREQMQQYRSMLQAANGDYFRLLETELARRGDGLVRCRCPQRFVCLRRVAGRTANHPGRDYYGCPLFPVVGRVPQMGGAARTNTGCGFFEYQ